MHAGDSGTTDASAGDAAAGDAGIADGAAPPDATIPDAHMTDGATTDAGMLDGSASDANPPDATIPDANVADGAVLDGSSADGALQDAALPDAGSCPCVQGLVCLDGRCLPGCNEDTSCGVTGAVCDTEGTAWCNCLDGWQPCDSTCCPVTTEPAHSSAFTGNVGRKGLALKLDQDGHPHLVMVELLNPYTYAQALWYAHHDGLQWEFQQLEEANVTGTPALALDDQGQPHVAYSTAQTSLIYACRNGSTGLFEKYFVELDGQIGLSNAIALSGSLAQVHIASAGSWLSYYVGGPGNWDEELVDNNGGTDPSLAVTGSGVPHIAFYDWGNNDNALRHAVRTGPASWSIHTIDTGFPETVEPSLQLERNEIPVIAFHDTTLSALRVAVQVSPTSWGVVTLDKPGSGNAGFFPALGLDPFNDLMVAYMHSTGSVMHVRMARYRNGVSNVSVVDRGTGQVGVGVYLDMEFAPDGSVVLAYHDWDHRNITLARW